MDVDPAPTVLNAPQAANRFRNRIVRFFPRLNLSEQSFLISLAILVGVGCGAGSVLFQWLLDAAHRLLFVDAPALLGNPFLFPLIPALGGLAAGLIASFYASEARGPGVAEVMNAIITRRGVIRARVMVAKAFASAFTLGSGGSAGSEGPIIQIGAAWGSTVGRLFRFSEANLKTLIACGASAGISAIFNAPIAGVLFSLEIILGDFTIAAFTPVVISSVMAAVVAKAYMGERQVFEVPDYQFVNLHELGWYVILAVIAGVAGAVFIRLLYATEDLFNRQASGMPSWLKPAVGGALVGLIGLGCPPAMGVGYEIVGAALQGQILLPMLGLLLGLKLLSTSLTVGSGASGGLFAPSLFVGATLGGAFGRLAEKWLPGVISPPGAYAVVGMSAFVAATTHAPLTSSLIIVEMTGNYRLILPLMFTTVLAVAMARVIERESIYSLKLRRRGLNIHQGRDLSVLEKLPVSRIVRRDFDFIREHTPLREIVDLIGRSNLNDFPLMDDRGGFRGMIWFHDIREVMLEYDMHALLIAEDVMGKPPPFLEPSSSLADALVQFSNTDADALPVFRSNSREELEGIITRSDLLRSYERELLIRGRTTG